MYPQVKLISANGQVYLGKAFVGKMILIEQTDEGTWIIKTGEFIPTSSHAPTLPCDSRHKS